MKSHRIIQPIRFWRVYATFNGCGFDFDVLSQYVGIDKLKDEEAYVSYLNQQIQIVEDEYKLSFYSFKRILTKTPLEDYAETLFLVLCRIDEKSYHPYVSYCYKKPSEKQKKLIAKMLEIYPYNDVKVKTIDEDGEEDEELHSEDDSSRQKSFCLDIDGLPITIDNYEHQKTIFSILTDEYVRAGLDQVFYFGEENSLTCDDHLQISEHHLTQQLKGNRGGKNKLDFIRDVIYKLKFLIDIEYWAECNPDFYAKFPLDYRPGFIDEFYKQSNNKPLSRKNGSLVADILQFFSLYDAGSYNDRSARIISLYKSSNVNIQTLFYMINNMILISNKLFCALNEFLDKYPEYVPIALETIETIEKRRIQ